MQFNIHACMMIHVCSYQVTLAIAGPLVIAAGFYTPMGALTVAGIHGLPLALYYWSHSFPWSHPPAWLQWAVIGILGLGRCLCAAVEVSMVLCVREQVNHVWEQIWHCRSCVSVSDMCTYISTVCTYVYSLNFADLQYTQACCCPAL